MSSSDSNKKVVIKSSDGEDFEVEEAVAMQSSIVKAMLDDLSDQPVCPLANVTGKVLAKVVEYCNGRQANSDETRKKELEFIDGVKDDFDMLFDLILAAHYLDIPALLNVTTQAVADKIKDMSPEDVRKLFNIENDFTPEEEAKVRKENAWAFEN